MERLKVLVVDANEKVGGQLFKQIHKFFGSSMHRAGIRGIDIGEELRARCAELHVELWVNALAMGLYDNNVVAVDIKKENGDHTLETIHAENIVIATGAAENAVRFPGWTLPGVMGAGAAQTMMNLHGTLPGKRVLMLGSGNVGLIVSYQLMQAGADVVALVEAAPGIGGYGVHAGKIRRAGVPFYVSHTIKEVIGKDEVEKVTIVQVDSKFQQVPGTEKTFDVDTLCLAVGLNPMTELIWMAGCEFCFIPAFGGHVPLHDRNMETSVAGLYVAGDVTGVEEASSAMEEGNMAGVAAAEALGYLSAEDAAAKKAEITGRLNTLRSGQFGEKRRVAKEQQLQYMADYQAKKGGSL